MPHLCEISLYPLPLKWRAPLLPSKVSAAPEAAAPKQKIKIKLRSYWTSLIEDSCKLKSLHVHKDARSHFEIRTHQCLIDILYPTAQMIDLLMQLALPADVDVEVKL